MTFAEERISIAEDRPKLPLHPTVALGLLVIVLVLTWAALFWAVQIATWGLAPYDTVPPAQRPALGTRERSLNDFFESSPGSELPAVLIVGMSVVLSLVGLAPIANSPAGLRLFEHDELRSHWPKDLMGLLGYATIRHLTERRQSAAGLVLQPHAARGS